VFTGHSLKSGERRASPRHLPLPQRVSRLDHSAERSPPKDTSHLGGERTPIIVVAVAVGALGVLVVTGAVAAGWPTSIGWGIGLLAAEYAVCVLGEGRGIDLAAPIVGALLVVTAELAYTSCDWRKPHAISTAVELRRWLRIGGVVTFGAVVGLGALALTSAADADSPAALVIGGGCVVALMVLFAVLHRQG
jgi:hypothetical protein